MELQHDCLVLAVSWIAVRKLAMPTTCTMSPAWPATTGDTRPTGSWPSAWPMTSNQSPVRIALMKLMSQSTHKGGESVSGNGSFALRDETMWYQPHGSLITFSNWFGILKTKSGGGIPARGRVGDVLGRDFVLRGPKPIFKKWSNCHVADITWLSQVV